MLQVAGPLLRGESNRLADFDGGQDALQVPVARIRGCCRDGVPLSPEARKYGESGGVVNQEAQVQSVRRKSLSVHPHLELLWCRKRRSSKMLALSLRLKSHLVLLSCPRLPARNITDAIIVTFTAL